MDKVLYPLEEISPVGVWDVTTEAGSEGKNIKKLGLWRGHIVDIAFHLGPLAYYSLCFDIVNKAMPKHDLGEPGNRRCDEIDLLVDIQTGTWDMDPHRRVAVMVKFFAKYPTKNLYRVVHSNMYGCVALEFLGLRKECAPWWERW